MDAAAPALVAVDADPHALATTRRELEKRYGADYEVVCDSSAEAAAATLERLRREGRQVAAALVDRHSGGEQLLSHCRGLHPNAKRLLLVAPDDAAARDPIAHAAAHGLIDGFAAKPIGPPAGPPAEQFHRAVVELLEEWTWLHGSWHKPVRVLGEPLAARSHELRDILARASIPHEFDPADSADARRLLGGRGARSVRLPAVVVHGRVLFDPSDAELADALGSDAELDPEGYDVVVAGAGPAGLGAAVYAASEGLRTLVLDQGPYGGQAGTSSLIRNDLGFPLGIGGEQLARRGYVQAVLFGAAFLFGRRLIGLRRQGDDLELALSDGTAARGRAAVLATGVAWRRLGVPTLEERLGAGVFYGASSSEAAAFAGEEVYVVGGGNSAGQAALHLARFAAHVTLIVRGSSLRKRMSAYLVDQLEASSNVRVLVGTQVVEGQGRGRLERLVLEDGGRARRTVPATGLFVLIGAEPRTGWLPTALARDDRGFLLTGPDLGLAQWPLERPPLLLETSIPGVFAAGDVRQGSVKRVVAAAGEGALAIQLCHRYLEDWHRELVPVR